MDDTALILYTSGSTGVPKGVELTQRNIININYNYINYFNLPEGGTGNYMCLAKFTFVASLAVYAALMHGFEALIVNETTKESISNIVNYLKTFHCYLLITTEDLGLYLYNNFDLNLDNLALAGSSLSKSEVRSDCSTILFNAYGCSETSGVAIINKLNKDYSDYYIIGKPWDNSNVYILDDNKKQLPVGAVGEIVISGPAVTKQYLNNTEQTKKSYGEFNGKRAYFTNDLAYFNEDGNVVYVGRKDNQINLNGFRIEPEGVESTIFEYDSFNQVKVVIGKVNSQDHLIAYYSSDVDIDEDDLKEYLSVNLPSYMVPSFYVHMDSLPLNPNGKIDVKSLPSVEFDEVDFVEPKNEFEEIVVKVFEKFFNQKNISVYDNFIHLGGTSVTAMKIVRELADYNLSVNNVISLGTPIKIAEHIKNNTQMDLNYSKYSLDKGCPLNESQLNVYLDIIRYEKNDVYNIPLTITIPGNYTADDIKNALYEMFNVHTILKSFINVVDGTACLKTGVNPKVDYLNENDEEVISDFIDSSFDINSSLARFLLVDEGNDEDWILFGVFHHLIFDGFSSIVFKQHLFDLLEGKLLKLDNGIVKSRVYDEEIVKTNEYSDAEAFYESMLCEVDDVSSILSDVGDNEAGSYSLNLDVSNSDIDVLLKSYDISENILFTGVFAYTLSRFTGDNQVLFNVLNNGRDNLSNYESIGMFVNTLPLLVDCNNKDVSSFMGDVKELIFNVFSYNFYPFRILTQEYNINSSILFQFHPNFDDVNEQYFNVSDLEFRIFEINNKYIVKVIYSSEFSSDTIKRFVESYNMILNQLLGVDNLSDINYVSSSDLELLDTYNDTSYDLTYSDLLDAFNVNLEKSPDNILVSYRDKSYTYGEGAFIADKIALSLKDMGIHKQDKVGFLVEKSELYMFCVLGILSYGGVYVPLDNNHPDERIRFILDDTDSRVIIVSDETYSRVSGLTDRLILNISDFFNEDLGCLDYLPVVYGDLACILYTSGTTGLPKGVKITRKSLINVCEYYITEYGLNDSDVYGMFSNIGFDVGNFAINVVMCVGACLSVIPEDIRMDMLKLNDYFIRHNVSHTYVTTQVGKLFMESVDETSLDIMLVGGEKLGNFIMPKGYRVIDAYGPTEAYTFVSLMDNNDKLDSSSVGFANYNIRFYVLDDELRRVPLGAVGELYIAGYQLARGYLNRNDETNKAFINNPFDDEEGYEQIYKTGDLVRLLPDGSLGIVGRRDGQVKIRGNRVELSEIEVVIRELDCVDDVTVQTIQNGGINELVAYVVSDEIDGDELSNIVQNHVDNIKPHYMVPSFVIKLDAIPLNVNGKVDKHALPNVDLDSLRAEYVAPRNENEKKLVEAFEKALDLEKVSIYDDFLRLGGDSLSAIKVVSYIKSIDVSMADILSYRTPDAIAKNMNDLSFDLDIYSVESGCPLNAAQVNVFADVTVYNKANAYHIPGYFPISKKYSSEEIIDSLENLLKAHPILSMRFNGEYEVNDADDTSKIDLIKILMRTAKKFGIKKFKDIIASYGLNISGLINMLKSTIKLFKGDYPYLVKGSKPPITLKSNATKEDITDFFATSLDLYSNLSKFMIIEYNETYYLLYQIHHVIFDATSAGIFKKDFIALLEGGSVDLDETFLKTSAFTHQIKNTEKFEEASEFYEPILSDIESVGSLVEDNSSSEGYNISYYDLEFDKDTFRSFLENNEITENILFTGVFAYTLSQFVEGDKVLFTMIENGRDRFHENFIGMTSNVMPLVMDCQDQSINSYIENMANLIYDASRYSYYPILLLYQEYNFEVDILFQFIPNWIADEFDNLNDMPSNDIFNCVLNNFKDFIAEFFVQVNQNEDDYILVFMNSNKYSDKLIEDFKETFISVLSNIIKSDVSTDLSKTLNRDNVRK